MKLAIIVRADKTGLGNQTRNLTYMLKPSKILVIDSSSFNHNKQYFNMYDGFNSFLIRGFPTNRQARIFLSGIDSLLTCETFYNPIFMQFAKSLRIRTYNQFNYEFLDNLSVSGYPIPTKFFAPSYWMLEEMKQKFPNTEYLPPPTDARMFTEARNFNFNNNGKNFLHIVGKRAIMDRNGTFSLLDSLKYTAEDFNITVKSQDVSDVEDIMQKYTDRRIHWDFSNPVNEQDLYRGFDALILPRRYAGLCLPMNEALMSGLPVIMTDIVPNNKVLPKEWLVESRKVGELKTRTMIDVYAANEKKLAKKIEWLCNTNLNVEKAKAFEIGYNNYSYESLKPKYESALQ